MPEFSRYNPGFKRITDPVKNESAVNAALDRIRPLEPRLEMIFLYPSPGLTSKSICRDDHSSIGERRYAKEPAPITRIAQTPAPTAIFFRSINLLISSNSINKG